MQTQENGRLFELLTRLENSPNRDRIYGFWNNYGLNIKWLIESQYYNEHNLLPDTVLDPRPEDVVIIRMKGLAYCAPVKDIWMMGITLPDFSREPWLDKVLATVKPGELFMDVGAHIGLYTIPVALKTNVIAFEADGQNFELLKMNVELNRVQNKVTLIKAAVSDDSYEKWLFKGPHGMLSTMIDPQGGKVHGWEEVGSERVKCVTIDDFTYEHNLANIDYLKIDVEGAELSVLKGAQNVLKKGLVKNILIEMHPVVGEQATEIYRMLDQNYSLDVLWRDEKMPTNPFLHARLRTGRLGGKCGNDSTAKLRFTEAC